MNPITLGGVGVVALLLTLPATGLPQESDTPPDHVCLPSVSEEDAAWEHLEQEQYAARREFDAADAPAIAKWRRGLKRCRAEREGV